MQQMFTHPNDIARIESDVNRLNNQALVHYYEQEWHRGGPSWEGNATRSGAPASERMLTTLPCGVEAGAAGSVFQGWKPGTRCFLSSYELCDKI